MTSLIDTLCQHPEVQKVFGDYNIPDLVGRQIALCFLAALPVGGREEAAKVATEAQARWFTTEEARRVSLECECSQFDQCDKHRTQQFRYIVDAIAPLLLAPVLKAYEVSNAAMLSEADRANAALRENEALRKERDEAPRRLTNAEREDAVNILNQYAMGFSLGVRLAAQKLADDAYAAEAQLAAAKEALARIDRDQLGPEDSTFWGAIADANAALSSPGGPNA